MADAFGQEPDLDDGPEAGSGGVTPITVTLKAGKGFDAPWIVVRGSSVEEVREVLEDPGLGGLMKRTSEVATYFQDRYTPGSGSDSASRGSGSSGRSSYREGGSGRSTSRAAAREDPPGWAPEPPECDHGERVFATGEGKNGTWYAWDCPEKGTDDACRKDREFFNRPKSGGRRY